MIKFIKGEFSKTLLKNYVKTFKKGGFVLDLRIQSALRFSKYCSLNRRRK